MSRVIYAQAYLSAMSEEVDRHAGQMEETQADRRREKHVQQAMVRSSFDETAQKGTQSGIPLLTRNQQIWASLSGVEAYGQAHWAVTLMIYLTYPVPCQLITLPTARLLRDDKASNGTRPVKLA